MSACVREAAAKLAAELGFRHTAARRALLGWHLGVSYLHVHILLMLCRVHMSTGRLTALCHREHRTAPLPGDPPHGMQAGAGGALCGRGLPRGRAACGGKRRCRGARAAPRRVGRCAGNGVGPRGKRCRGSGNRCMLMTDTACRKGTLLSCPGTNPPQQSRTGGQGHDKVSKGLLGSILTLLLMEVSVSTHIPFETHTACTCVCLLRALRRLVLWAHMPRLPGRQCLRSSRGRTPGCAKPSARHALQSHSHCVQPAP